MAILNQPDIPPEVQAFWDKFFRWCSRYGVPSMAAKWFQTGPKPTEQRLAATKLPTATTYWKALDDATKAAWRSAAYKATGYHRGFRMFCSDWQYRNKMYLSLPGAPSDEHQLFGLQLTNPGGALDVEARRDDKDLIGPIAYKLSFKKTEITPSATYKFFVQCTAYWFTSGSYGIDSDIYNAVAGNINWTILNRSFGTSGRKYFHFKIQISILNYDANVQIDNFELSDSSGVIMKENWNTVRYVPWVPRPLYRKQDWEFKPGYAEPYFKHLYLE